MCNAMPLLQLEGVVGLEVVEGVVVLFSSGSGS